MNCYNDYVKKLKLVCGKKKAALVEIGRTNNFPLYKIVINPQATAAVVFSAGIHGDEVAGPWAILDFLKRSNFKKHPGVKVIIFPVANPTAFDKKKRLNHLDKDINNLFRKKSLTNENKILIQQLKKEKVFFFHALHEDLDASSFYLYCFEDKKEKIYREFIKLAKAHFPINNSAKIYNRPATKGLIIMNSSDGSFEDRVYHDGARYSMCTETPGKQQLKERIALSVAIMNKALDFTALRSRTNS